MSHITQVQIKRIKSFNKPIRLDFTKGMSVIVGPNGSGKSNVLDALCFALGRLSTKSIRADNYAELLHKDKHGKVLGEGYAAFSLDNSSKVFPVDSKKIDIVREINRSGQTVYRVNGKRATRQQVLELLSMAKVGPEGHNIILQNDISKFISMSQVEKRRIIEEIAGISTYETKKDSALKELEKVEKRLNDASIILTEKKTYMESLEADKKQAEKFKSYQNELSGAKATELNLKLKSINQRRDTLKSKFDKVEAEDKKAESIIKESEKKIKVLRDKISVIEKQIEKKGGEDQLSLQKSIEDLKITLENSKNLVQSSKNEIRRIGDRKKQLQDSLKDIEKKIAEKTKEKDRLDKEVKTMLSRENELKKVSFGAAKNIEELEANAEKADLELIKLKEDKDLFKDKKQKLDSDLQIVEYKLTELSNKLSEAKEIQNKLSKVGKDRDRYRDIIQKINTFSADSAKLNSEVTELYNDQVALKEELARLRISATATQELLQRDKAISTIVKQNDPGVFGTVAELGKVDSRYSTALQVIAGSRMKNLVVRDPNVAIKYLKLLKQTKSGTVTFLPVSNLNPPLVPSYVRNAVSTKGVIGLAKNLISCDDKFKKVFDYVFGNNLVVENTDIAKRLGVGKFNMVTVDGDIFRMSGAITGGFRRNIGLSFGEKNAQRSLDVKIDELSKLKKKLDAKEKEKSEVEKKITELSREKAELEGRIEATKDLSADSGSLFKNKEELMKQKKAIEDEKKKLEREFKSIEDKINKKTIEKNALKSKAQDIKFGKQRQELGTLESKRSLTESQLAAIKATLENALLPEKNNILRVLESLGKEAREFENQIKSEESGLSKLQKELSGKERDEKKFYGELKELFSNKNKLLEFFKKEEDILNQIKEKQIGENEERNSISIAKARLEAELAAVKEEMEPVKKAQVLPYLKTIKEAKDKQESLSRRIDEMGNVNMRALEVYNEVKGEYDKLHSRITVLGREREDVLSVINKIEFKKKSSFLSTFDAIKNNFSNIFTRIAEDLKGELVLENVQSPFDGGIEFKITKEKGRSVSIAALSGGEKVLVALAFIFAIQEHEPAPFYLLDEVDAALDSVNSERVAKLLKEYSNKAQVVVVSHNDAVISAAEQIYGVWRNKEGESSINSLKI